MKEKAHQLVLPGNTIFTKMLPDKEMVRDIYIVVMDDIPLKKLEEVFGITIHNAINTVKPYFIPEEQIFYGDLLIALEAGLPVGYLSYSITKDLRNNRITAKFEDIEVGYKRCGIGRKLYEHVLVIFENEKAKFMTSSPILETEEALKFWQKMAGKENLQANADGDIIVNAKFRGTSESDRKSVSGPGRFIYGELDDKEIVFGKDGGLRRRAVVNHTAERQQVYKYIMDILNDRRDTAQPAYQALLVKARKEPYKLARILESLQFDANTSFDIAGFLLTGAGENVLHLIDKSTQVKATNLIWCLLAVEQNIFGLRNRIAYLKDWKISSSGLSSLYLALYEYKTSQNKNKAAEKVIRLTHKRYEDAVRIIAAKAALHIPELGKTVVYEKAMPVLYGQVREQQKEEEASINKSAKERKVTKSLILANYLQRKSNSTAPMLVFAGASRTVIFDYTFDHRIVTYVPYVKKSFVLMEFIEFADAGRGIRYWAIDENQRKILPLVSYCLADADGNLYKQGRITRYRFDLRQPLQLPKSNDINRAYLIWWLAKGEGRKPYFKVNAASNAVVTFYSLFGEEVLGCLSTFYSNSELLLEAFEFGDTRGATLFSIKDGLPTRMIAKFILFKEGKFLTAPEVLYKDTTFGINVLALKALFEKGQWNLDEISISLKANKEILISVIFADETLMELFLGRFKELLNRSGQDIMALSKKLGISDHTLRYWLKHEERISRIWDLSDYQVTDVKEYFNKGIWDLQKISTALQVDKGILVKIMFKNAPVRDLLIDHIKETLLNSNYNKTKVLKELGLARKSFNKYISKNEDLKKIWEESSASTREFASFLRRKAKSASSVTVMVDRRGYATQMYYVDKEYILNYVSKSSEFLVVNKVLREAIEFEDKRRGARYWVLDENSNKLFPKVSYVLAGKRGKLYKNEELVVYPYDLREFENSNIPHARDINIMHLVWWLARAEGRVSFAYKTDPKGSIFLYTLKEKAVYACTFSNAPERQLLIESASFDDDVRGVTIYEAIEGQRGKKLEELVLFENGSYLVEPRVIFKEHNFGLEKEIVKIAEEFLNPEWKLSTIAKSLKMNQNVLMKYIFREEALKKTVVERIRVLLEVYGKDIQNISKDLGVTSQQLRNWLNRKTEIIEVWEKASGRKRKVLRKTTSIDELVKPVNNSVQAKELLDSLKSHSRFIKASRALIEKAISQNWQKMDAMLLLREIRKSSVRFIGDTKEAQNIYSNLKGKASSGQINKVFAEKKIRMVVRRFEKGYKLRSNVLSAINNDIVRFEKYIAGKLVVETPEEPLKKQAQKIKAETKTQSKPSVISLDIYISQLKDALRSNDLGAVIKIALRALIEYPLSEKINRYLGEAYLRSGQEDEALASFQKSLRIANMDPAVHRWLGIFYRDAKGKRDIDEALLYFERARSLYKDQEKIAYCLCDEARLFTDEAKRSLKQNNEPAAAAFVKKAIAKYEEAIETKPVMVEPYKKLGHFLNYCGFYLQRRGNLKAAAEYYEQALSFLKRGEEVSSFAPFLLRDIAFSFQMLAEIDKEKGFLPKALVNYEKAKVYFNRAKILSNRLDYGREEFLQGIQQEIQKIAKKIKKLQNQLRLTTGDTLAICKHPAQAEYAPVCPNRASVPASEERADFSNDGWDYLGINIIDNLLVPSSRDKYRQILDHMYGRPMEVAKTIESSLYDQQECQEWAKFFITDSGDTFLNRLKQSLNRHKSIFTTELIEDYMTAVIPFINVVSRRTQTHKVFYRSDTVRNVFAKANECFFTGKLYEGKDHKYYLQKAMELAQKNKDSKMIEKIRRAEYWLEKGSDPFSIPHPCILMAEAQDGQKGSLMLVDSAMRQSKVTFHYPAIDDFCQSDEAKYKKVANTLHEAAQDIIALIDFFEYLYPNLGRIKVRIDHGSDYFGMQ
ncbi:MAG: hypothetical protein AAB089_00220, partial [Nitrospirota bacterium]